MPASRRVDKQCPIPGNSVEIRCKVAHETMPPPNDFRRTEPLHPRNRHQGRYDLKRLVQVHPALGRFVARNAYGDDSIDFADPVAVRTLNAALLGDWHGVVGWDLPEGFLCPPIPGRADYLHHAADLLAGDTQSAPPRGRPVRVLDVGTGASVIYPLIGHGEYGWSFVGSEVDPQAIASAQCILRANPRHAQAIELRRQTHPQHIFNGIVHPGEAFALIVCNPPFHVSAAAAREGSQRKWRNLGRADGGRQAPNLNFGGQAGELWCPGGEIGFIGRMIGESTALGSRCRWFTSLVARQEHVGQLQALARKAGATDVRVVPMGQGQKQSRFIAWTFVSVALR